MADLTRVETASALLQLAIEQLEKALLGPSSIYTLEVSKCLAELLSTARCLEKIHG